MNGAAFVVFVCAWVLDLHDLDGLGAFWAGGHLELDGVALVEALEAVAENVAVMNERVGPIIRGDESEPLGIVKPLYLTIGHFMAPFTGP